MKEPVRPVTPHDFPFTFVFPKHDFAYLAMPKCGTKSLRASMYNADSFPEGQEPASTREEGMKMSTRFAVIRDPVMRAFSARANRWPKHSFEEWWAVVRENPRMDLHTYPFSEYVAEDATEIYCLEDIALWWPEMRERYPELFTAEIPRINQATYVVQQEYYDDICNVYKNDLELWRRIKR